LAVANFAWRATLLTAVNARMTSPRLLSNVVRFLILILAVAMALEQIAVAQTVVLTAFAIAFGAVMIGLAIAFGIGGGGIARRFLEQQFPERPPSDADRISHL
jgi:small-conductance mechanosensitive channel